ncbi:hypothetical protein BLOT_002682 [Blomia tropicalis]|nr:hypothetical protein BLOT_002682 [Blomia tropicalis]
MLVTLFNTFIICLFFDNLFPKDKFQPNSFSSYIDNYSKQNRFKRLNKMEKTKFNETTAKHSDSDYYESSETTYQTIINLNTTLSSTSESTKRISSTLSLTSSILSMYNDSNLNALLSIITIVLLATGINQIFKYRSNGEDKGEPIESIQEYAEWFDDRALAISIVIVLAIVITIGCIKIKSQTIRTD